MKQIAHPNSIKITTERIVELCNELSFTELPLKNTQILQLKNLKRMENAPIHKDPFDRIMICQAIDENMIFITHDKMIQYYQSDNIFMV